MAYGAKPRTRVERAARLEADKPTWVTHLPPPAAQVIRAIARQFERAGTDALDSDQLWSTGEVSAAKGLTALKQGGDPTALLRKTKETIFGA